MGTYGGQGRGTGIARLTESGLQRLTTADGLADDRTEDLLEDRDGRVWVATWGGLNCWDGEEFHSYTTADGLPHNHVRCLHQDPHGDLWLGTDAGVCHWDGRTFQTIHSPHVLATNQILQGPEGMLWFATLHGLVQYTPSAVPPRVRLLQVLADRTYPAEGPVEVPASCRQVVFEYKGMSFRTPPAGMRYTGRLQGHQEDWQPGTAARRAFFRDLGPGDHTFQVRAIDQDHNYSEPVVLPVRVVPDLQVEGPTAALRDAGAVGELIGSSPALAEARAHLGQVVHTDLPILLLGETGTGKGVAARALHAASRRASGPFIVLGCGNISPQLADSELFGHEKGAFTGASARKLGRVELAHGGTLFLDEIGELPRELQQKLLQFLDGHGFVRVGGTQTLTADVRLLAATNRDLHQMDANGQFRADLFFRLGASHVTLPPLRSRREDIPVLAVHFAAGMAAHLGRPAPRLAPAAQSLLESYAWAGNVRELRAAMERAAVICRGDAIEPRDLPRDLMEGPVPSEPESLSLADCERRHLLRVLEHSGWVIRGPRGAAARLGLPATSLRDRMRKLGITRLSR